MKPPRRILQVPRTTRVRRRRRYLADARYTTSGGEPPRRFPHVHQRGRRGASRDSTLSATPTVSPCSSTSASSPYSATSSASGLMAGSVARSRIQNLAARPAAHRPPAASSVSPTHSQPSSRSAAGAAPAEVRTSHSPHARHFFASCGASAQQYGQRRSAGGVTALAAAPALAVLAARAADLAALGAVAVASIGGAPAEGSPSPTG